MFANLAEMTILGRVTRNLELKTIGGKNGDQSVTQFDIAVDTGTKEKPETLFVSCSAFGRTAEHLARFVGKGCRLYVTGRVHPNSYTTKDGVKAVSFKVVVNNIQIIDKKDESGAPKTETKLLASAFSVDDIPF